FALVIDEGVIDGQDAVSGVTGIGGLLHQLQTAAIEFLGLPDGVGEEAIETGLVGGLGKLAVNTADGLVLGDIESGEVFGEVASLRFVGEEIAELAQGLLNDRGELNDTGHDNPRCRARPLASLY